MENSIRNRVFAGGLLCCCLMGCAAPDTKSNYPTSPPSAAANAPGPTVVGSTPASPTAPAVPAAVKVPADATELSHGDYPPPAFTVPAQPGLIMVVDMDGDPTTAVASTAVDGKDAGKQMSITDVANMSITMNKLHRYRIVFVPSKATAP